MKVACFIPIKTNSERVPGKNFRELNGKKLYQYIIEHATNAGIFDKIFVDTNSEEIFDYARECGCIPIKRKEELALNTANGNDLLRYHFDTNKGYDFYFQLFATAPYLQPQTIRKCAEELINSNKYDSCFTATKHNSFFWLNDSPINYRPCILPRSQDMVPLYEETTGMYGIRADALERYGCRIGANPYVCIVNKFEAVDINTEEDLKLAEFIGKNYWGY